MTIPAKLKSRKLWALITGIVAIFSAWCTDQLSAGQAIAGLVPLLLGYIGVQGYQDVNGTK